ncbi:hypothetical protein F4861DRAFT_417808 [Xylaria intraflava]|nr:hypothetical protein F4861DRAFT_417808 [Xylaria intraflava]
MPFSLLLTAAVAMAPFLAMSEPIPSLVGVSKAAAHADPSDDTAAGEQQDPNICCTLNCIKCTGIGCTNMSCLYFPYWDCCAVMWTQVLEDGTVENYNVDGVKMEYISILAPEEISDA